MNLSLTLPPESKTAAAFPLPPGKLRDHLGNVTALVSDGKLPVGYALSPVDVDCFVAEVVSARDFYPFGMGMPRRGFEVGGYRYGFQGQEFDDEIKGQGNSVNYKYRMHDARLGRFLSIDPLAHKFPWQSPNVAFNNSPTITIDPDGREGIVVSGSPGDHKNKSHFLVNGLYKAKAAQKHFQRKGETVTWIVYNDPEGGYSQDQIDTYTKKAAMHGITLKVVTDADDIVDYVNEKTGEDSRKEDPITSFYYVGHATVGDLDVGYGGSGDYFEPDDFSSDAFSGGCHVNLVGGCRTTVYSLFEDSNVTQFQEILDENSNIYGTDVRVYYPGGIVSDEKLVEKNKGKIEHRKGELPAKKQ